MRDFRNLFLFDLFLLAILILATRLATFLHELMGHALMAATFGGEVNGVRVSLFGGGEAYYHLKTQSGLYVRFLVAFGGILVNMLSGLLPSGVGPVFSSFRNGEPSWRYSLFIARVLLPGGGPGCLDRRAAGARRMVLDPLPCGVPVCQLLCGKIIFHLE